MAGGSGHAGFALTKAGELVVYCREIMEMFISLLTTAD